MAIIKETKYLTFDSQKSFGKKTNTIYICNRASGHEIATIEWYGAWRQYCFFPTREFDTVWNLGCLKDIMSVIEMLMKERIIEKPERE